MATRRTRQQETVWPLGAYLREQRGKMAIREAARRADISESRWRQVEAGVQKMAGGIEVPVHPRPETVAAMCNAISADVRHGLELAGHNPAQYKWLLDPATDVMGDDDRMGWFAKLPRTDRETMLAELQRLHVDVEVRRNRTG
jgi:hypothetical protein